MSWIRNLTGLWIMFAVITAVGVLLNSFAWLMDRILALPPLPPAPLNAYLFVAALSMVIGLFWLLWAYSYLRFVGRGSPIELLGLGLYPTEQLVTTGPYAYTRNPMFLGLLFLLLAVGLLNGSITALVLLPIVTLAGLEYIRVYEEPVLAERFGEEYRLYRRSSPALIPRLRR